MDKRLVAVGIMVAMAFPSLAARRTTVEQLRQIVTSAASTHKADDAVAAQVFEVELSERLSTVELNKFIAASAGPKTIEALHVVADQSVFLDLPASELPVRPVPDVAAQKYMLNQTIHYVARTLHSLPDFLATRETAHYDDAPRAETAGGWPTRTGMHFETRFEMPIAYRDGRETDDPSLTGSKSQLAKVSAGKKGHDKASAPPNVGLTSWGEFGPILEIVLLDASKGKLGWSHWEQEDGKFLAVFQFAAGRANSHYSVQYEDRSQGERVASSYGSGREGGGVSAGQQKDTDAIQHKDIVAYHGRITVDPDTGTVRRITIEAEPPSGSIIQRAGIMVEYGQVKINGSDHIGPVRSVSVSVADSLYRPTPTASTAHISQLQLNDVKFTNYRRFGSEATLVMSSADAKPEESGPAVADAVSGAPQPATPPSADAATAATATTESAQPAISPAAEVAAAAPVVPPGAIPGETDEEIIVRDVNGLPGMGSNPDTAAAGSTSSASGNFTLQVTTRLVNLGLIAVDKHGKPVNDLKPEEIEIYDNGRKQRISAFRHNNPAASTTQTTQPSEPELTFTNTAGTVQATQESPDLLVLLMDESHLPYNDINRARAEIERFLKATRPNSRIALYSINEHGFRVIQDVTVDHALVETKLTAWMPSAAGASQAAELDTRNRQQFDTVRNPEDLAYVNGHHDDNPDTQNSSDPQLRQLGDNPLAQALGAMVTIARHFAAVPGHKSLTWISGDSVLYDFSDQTVSMERTVKDWTGAINRTKEALNEAHMALYAVDASMISSGSATTDSSLANASIQLAPTSTQMSKPGGAQVRDQGGRMTAEMQQDTRSIQGPVRTLAESTGGRAINKGSDLKATLDSIEQESVSLYEVAFNPDTPADNKFHTLQLKVPGRKDVKLRYRTGYLYNEEATDTKQRFQEAVWSPQDLSGISLTAEALPGDASSEATLKLRIGFAGINFQQKGDRWADDLYIFIAQRDDAAQKAQVTGDTLRLSLKQGSYESGMPAGIPYRHTVEGKSKLGSVRVIVVDGNSGKMGSVTLPSSALQP